VGIACAGSSPAFGTNIALIPAAPAAGVAVRSSRPYALSKKLPIASEPMPVSREKYPLISLTDVGPVPIIASLFEAQAIEKKVRGCGVEQPGSSSGS
jgi:hypothetical protein